MSVDKGSDALAQILAFAPMVLPMLGVPQAKQDLVLAALNDPTVMVGENPNIVRLMKLKGDLEAVDTQSKMEPVTARLICRNCEYCNTFNLGG